MRATAFADTDGFMAFLRRDTRSGCGSGERTARLIVEGDRRESRSEGPAHGPGSSTAARRAGSSSLTAQEPLVSVVIPAYQAARTLPLCLEALSRQGSDRGSWEVIVVDDGSTDGSGDIAAALGAIVVRQENRGASAARNRGAAQARGELLVFIDADCIPGPDLVQGHVRAFRESGGGAFVGGAIEHYRPGACWVSYCDHYASAWYMQDPRAPRDGVRPYLHTTNLGIPRRLHDAIGPFDESLATGEDVDYCGRAQEAGIPMIFDPRIPAFHVGRPTLAAFIRRHYRWGTHAVSLRRRRRNLPYHWAFPSSRLGAILLGGPLVAAYSVVLLRGWYTSLGFGALGYLPAIVVSRAAWGLGLVRGAFTAPEPCHRTKV